MKRSILILALLWAIAVVPSTADAQITITAQDVELLLSAGNTLTNRADSLTATADIGSPGASSWDFSGLMTHSSQTLTSVTASSTPHIADFPTATHTFQTIVTYGFITGPVYQYLRLGADFENLGNKGTGVYIFTFVLTTTNIPAEIVYGLPCTIGKTWTTTYTATQTVTANGQPFLPTTVTSHNALYVVDAYGPMKLPGNYGTHQALRIRKTDTIQKDQGSPYMATTWIFLARNGASVQLYACDTLVQSGVISTRCGNTITWSAPVNDSTYITGVQVAGTIPTETRLLQNYPNPFNPTTNIQFTIANRQLTIVKVYDLIGREVSTLVNEVKEPGIYTVGFDASGLASGAYFCRLQAPSSSGQAGDFSQTKTLLLLR